MSTIQEVETSLDTVTTIVPWEERYRFANGVLGMGPTFGAPHEHPHKPGYRARNVSIRGVSPVIDRGDGWLVFSEAEIRVEYAKLTY